MNITKNQHYVFQAYLTGFSIDHPDTDKFVWVYDKEFPTGNPPKQFKSVKSICSEVFYYSQNPEGDDILEKAFGTIENQVSPIIKNLTVTPGVDVILTEEERSQIAFIIGLSITRTPSFRDGIEKFHKRVAEATLEIVSKDIKGPNGETFEEYENKIGGIKIEVEKWVSLKPMIDLATQIGISVLGKHWQFFKAPQGISFVAGDNPAFFDYPKRIYGENPFVGPAHPLSEIVFPLRKDIALVCTPQGLHMNSFQCSKEEVQKFNRGTVRAARKYVIADFKSDSLSKIVLEYKNTEQRLIVD